MTNEFFHRNFKRYQQTAISVNRDKHIHFVDNLGNMRDGVIKGAHIIGGQFCYEVSETRNPRTEFNFEGRGRWHAIKPEQIIL